VKEPLFSLFFYSTKNGPAFPGGRIWSSSRLRTGLFFLLDKGTSVNQADADACGDRADDRIVTRDGDERLLADFRRRQLVQVMGSTLVIKNKSALESIVTG
jgi:hypothetical protein